MKAFAIFAILTLALLPSSCATTRIADKAAYHAGTPNEPKPPEWVACVLFDIVTFPVQVVCALGGGYIPCGYPL